MPSSIQRRRTHNLLLISKLLSCRDGSSPFTLVLDSLHHSGKPLLQEYVQRASASNTYIIYVSFETLQEPHGVDGFIRCNGRNFTELHKDVVKQILSTTTRTLLIIDSLHHVVADHRVNLASYLMSLTAPMASTVALSHLDVPLATASRAPRSPHPLKILKYLATTVLTTHSLAQMTAKKAARERSLAEPVFGLDEGKEGVVIGIGSNDRDGTIIEMEYRRKSGRELTEVFFLPAAVSASSKEGITLLEDHSLYRKPSAAVEERAEMDTTFSLGLTDKQRQDREGVVLPYFDAQKEGDTGEGGRILYDLGEEDDFDEEEDEI